MIQSFHHIHITMDDPFGILLFPFFFIQDQYQLSSGDRVLHRIYTRGHSNRQRPNLKFVLIATVPESIHFGLIFARIFQHINEYTYAQGQSYRYVSGALRGAAPIDNACANLRRYIYICCVFHMFDVAIPFRKFNIAAVPAVCGGIARLRISNMRVINE